MIEIVFWVWDKLVYLYYTIYGIIAFKLVFVAVLCFIYLIYRFFGHNTLKALIYRARDSEKQ